MCVRALVRCAGQQTKQTDIERCSLCFKSSLLSEKSYALFIGTKCKERQFNYIFVGHWCQNTVFLLRTYAWGVHAILREAGKQVMIFLLFFCGEKNRGVCDLRIIFLWAKINDCWFQDGKQTRHCRERSQAGARRIINTRQWFNITVSTPFWVRTKKIILQGVTSYQTTTTTKTTTVDNIITIIILLDSGI